MTPFDPTAETTLWHELNPRRARAPWSGSAADVAVIGAGMTGLVAAADLARAGLSVVVLEAGFVGCGATGRNVGFVLQGVAESYARTVALWGRERASRARRLTVHNHERLRARLPHPGACAYRGSGTLHLAGSDAAAEELEASHALLRQDGFTGELLAGSDLPPWARSRYRAGLRIPDDAEVDPVAFAQALADGAEAAGAAVLEGSTVLSVDDDADGVTLRLADRELRCETALFATNAWTDRLLPWCRQRIEPTRGQVLATAAAPPVFAQPVYASHGFEYWRQLPTGEIVLGGWRHLDTAGEVGHDHRVHRGIQEAMQGFLASLCPELRDTPVTHRWSGIMGFSRDSLPLVGPVPGRPRLRLAAGYTGHGFGFAVACGEVAAQQLVRGSSPWDDLLAPRRLG